MIQTSINSDINHLISSANNIELGKMLFVDDTYIINPNVSINYIDPDTGLNHLGFAIKHHNNEAVGWILNAVEANDKKVADVNGGKIAPLMMAVIANNSEAVQQLIQNDNIDINILQSVEFEKIDNSHMACNKVSPLWLALEMSRVAIAKNIIQDGEDKIDINYMNNVACNNGHDMHEETPVMQALRNNNLAVFTEIVRHAGLDINMVYDHNNRTILTYLISKDRKAEFIESLIANSNYCVDLNGQDALDILTQKLQDNEYGNAEMQDFVQSFADQCQDNAGTCSLSWQPKCLNLYQMDGLNDCAVSLMYARIKSVLGDAERGLMLCEYFDIINDGSDVFDRQPGLDMSLCNEAEYWTQSSDDNYVVDNTQDIGLDEGFIAGYD